MDQEVKQDSREVLKLEELIREVKQNNQFQYKIMVLLEEIKKSLEKK